MTAHAASALGEQVREPPLARPPFAHHLTAHIAFMSGTPTRTQNFYLRQRDLTAARPKTRDAFQCTATINCIAETVVDEPTDQMVSPTCPRITANSHQSPGLNDVKSRSEATVRYWASPRETDS
jgi:hypothetical protein